MKARAISISKRQIEKVRDIECALAMIADFLIELKEHGVFDWESEGVKDPTCWRATRHDDV